MLKRASYGLLALAPLVLLAGCGSDDKASDDSSGTTCSYPSAGPAAKKVDAPPATPSVSGTVKASIATSVGTIDLSLDATGAPCTVNSFVSLAKQGYFDNTTCHRLTTAVTGLSVLQCGDPTGLGNGGPGYSFADELTTAKALTTDEAATKKYDAQTGTGTVLKTYPAGTLAMANGGPDTNGSQFFIVYADSPLPPLYTVFGSVGTAGQKVVATVAQAGTANGSPDGAPKTPVNISKVIVD
jgi:peptidyl-prolyl cis-trans isomerase B (cyclophilin B)